MNSDEQPKPKRGRKPKAEAVESPAAKFIAALKFVTNAQTKTGPVPARHCMIRDGWIVGSDGVVTCATPIDSTLNCFPNSFRLLAALEQVTDDLVIAQANEYTVNIASGNFAVSVPCVPAFAIPGPDPLNVQVTDVLTDALWRAATFAVERAPDPILASVFLTSNTAQSTNRHCAIQTYHGFAMPPEGMLIPRASIDAICKTGKKLVGVGYSGPSVTFYFEDRSIVKTALYPAAQFPAIWHLFDRASRIETKAPPKGFNAAVKTIAAFSEDKSVLFDKSAIYSGADTARAASMQIESLDAAMKFDARYLVDAGFAFKKIAFSPDEQSMFFVGENVRGVIKSIDVPKNA